MKRTKELTLNEGAVSWIKEKISSSASGQVTIYITDRSISSIRFFSNEDFCDSVEFIKQ